MRRLLIANRGEIARRVIRTARRLGLETVAVYSDADTHAPHVREADRAFRLGPAPARESYLNINAVVDAIERSGADAVHPGYGFLSENAAFADAVTGAGAAFVGPPAAAIRAMGLKDAAKATMKAAGVPVTPGYQGEDQSLARLENAAARVGYPLLVKAVAGGGGKGMRFIHAASEFTEGVLAAKREAQSAFGNDTVLLEKAIMRARHVEVQVFADAHGNVVHLFERDCSLQRRHQKVIEEAPAPGLSDALRHRMHMAAVTAAMAIGYVNAGTVEFIVDLDDVDPAGDPAFYFIEMNTRLQVEHPVTEAITGLDLVEWQLRVAAGGMLPLNQDAIVARGHAVEARLYAEDPDNGFLPQAGRVGRIHWPAGAGVRVDAGVEAGQDVTIHYDPMIAKVVAAGADRAQAIGRLVGALDATVVDGLTTNRAFLARLAAHPEFGAGAVDTGFIARHADSLAAGQPEGRAAVLAALAVVSQPPPPPATAFAAAGGWRLNGPARRYVDLYAPDLLALTLTPDGAGWIVEAGGATVHATARARNEGMVEVELDGVAAQIETVFGAGWVEVREGGATARFGLTPPPAALAAGGSGRLLAPMPGRVLSVFVKAGDVVVAGDRLAVVEAMKMEHRLVAAVAGTVVAVPVAEGQQVAADTLLVEIEPE